MRESAPCTTTPSSLAITRTGAAPVAGGGLVVTTSGGQAVGLFETVDTPLGPVRFPGVPTWFSRTPGRVAGGAPELGAHTREVLEEIGVPAA